VLTRSVGMFGPTGVGCTRLTRVPDVLYPALLECKSSQNRKRHIRETNNRIEILSLLQRRELERKVVFIDGELSRLTLIEIHEQPTRVKALIAPRYPGCTPGIRA
jgi:hypothetical protein